MRKRMCLFPGMAVVLLFTILFAAGYTTPAIGNVNTVQAATKKKDISREGKKKRSIIKGKIFELEVDKPESVKDKNLTWSIKDSSIVTFAGKERHDDDIKFKALKAGTTKITCRNTKTDKKINFKITVKNVKKTTKYAVYLHKYARIPANYPICAKLLCIFIQTDKTTQPKKRNSQKRGEFFGNMDGKYPSMP